MPKNNTLRISRQSFFAAVKLHMVLMSNVLIQTVPPQVSQRRFLLDPSPESEDYQYFVPLTYTVVGDGQTDFDDYKVIFDIYRSIP